MHDWTRVEPGIFHAFHTAWIVEIQNVLNSGLLPAGFYALAEQHAGSFVADVLTLHASEESPVTRQAIPTAESGGTTVAEAPPRVRYKETVEFAPHSLRRTLAIRHVSTHRVVSLIEIVSPANKDRAEHVEEFAFKTVTALECGVNVLVVDMFPPGMHDQSGMHAEIRRRLRQSSDVTSDRPTLTTGTIASYVAGPAVDVYLEHPAVDTPLPEMPLFLSAERYISLPLEPSYQAAYYSMPAFWRRVVEGVATERG